MKIAFPAWSRALRPLVTNVVLPLGAWAAFGTAGPVLAQSGSNSEATKWVATWTAAPAGAATLAADTYSYTRPHPALQFPFPNLDTEGANNQTIRMIVKPDLWGNTMRFRFSNTFGTKPVMLGPVRVGLQEFSGVILEGTNTPVTFDGGSVNVTIPVGQEIYSDAVKLSWVQTPDDALLQGRNLAISFAVQGTSGPMTRHPVTFMTSYISAPGSGDHTAERLDFSYPYTTVSSYFLDAVDVMAPASTNVIAVFGDSITDGTFSTLNGNDRWSNFLSRRLHETYGHTVSVVNEAIGGNTVNSASSASSGPNAVTRLDRDVLGVSGLNTVIWMEGINDLGGSQQPPSTVISGYQNVVPRLHAMGIHVIGATLTSSFRPDQTYATSPLGTTTGPLYGSPQTLAEVQTVNNFITTSGLFDGVVDFFSATIDSTTNGFRAEFSVSSTDQASVDFLHPNRAGYLTMANAVDLSLLVPSASFFTGQVPLVNGVYYLQFPNGTPFGYYAYLSDPHYIYHFDLGYEYVFEANDGQANVFLYDFASAGFFYTGPSLWPYLYDFSLGAWLYYYPATSNPGHYTSNPRQFFNFKTNSVITK